MSPDKNSTVVSLARVIALRTLNSPAFAAQFRTTMKLVEDLAAYIDGPGRNECAALPRGGQFSYARESMLLTTRLMRIAAWFLLHQAVIGGERSLEEIENATLRVDVSTITMGVPSIDLPKTMRELIARANVMALEVIRLDGVLHPKESDTNS